ncbi:pectinesterase family protein [Marinimicrobium alkaliphilum]|uniref:pectinesterase family protein n=1 Tax=Marinimicrobium alkaliphilum TaxID=2202654 RepID=UPI000DB973BA|nr:pectinesterase family protein [Marinimicrobium alkaliphilum]
MPTRLLCLLTLILVAAACTWTGSDSSSQAYDAIVQQDGVDTRGTTPVYESVTDALAAAPADATAPHRILIRAGDYYEKLTITQPHIHLIGEGAERTRIYYDAYAGQEMAPGETWGTRRSGTVIVQAADVQFHRLTIENSFDFVGNDALDRDDPAKLHGTQAVALHLDSGSDRILAREVTLLGYQDTLFPNVGRSWFDRSVIAGNVDFIFGAGNALFTDSEIRTRIRGREHGTHGYVAAPSTDISRPFGFTFIDTQLTREPGVPDNSTALGRPWHPTTTFPDGRYADPYAVGKAIFIRTEMDAHITHEGWAPMGGTARDGGRKQFMPDEDARFFEYQSRGPGASTEHRLRRQLSDDVVKDFAVRNILGDWRP